MFVVLQIVLVVFTSVSVCLSLMLVVPKRKPKAVIYLQRDLSSQNNLLYEKVHFRIAVCRKFNNCTLLSRERAFSTEAERATDGVARARAAAG